MGCVFNGMNFKHLEIHARGDEVKSLVDAVDALPDGTLGDISIWDNLIVREGEWKDKKFVVGICSPEYGDKGLDLNIPRESACSVESSSDGIYFEYDGFAYHVRPVNSHRIVED